MPPEAENTVWSAEDFATPSEHYGEIREVEIDGKRLRLRYLDKVSEKQRLEADVEDWQAAFAGKPANFGTAERPVVATLTREIIKIIATCVHQVVEPQMGFKQWAALAESNAERFNRVAAEITRMNIDEDGIVALKKSMSEEEILSFLGSDFAYKLPLSTSTEPQSRSENPTSDAP